MRPASHACLYRMENHDHKMDYAYADQPEIGTKVRDYTTKCSVSANDEVRGAKGRKQKIDNEEAEEAKKNITSPDRIELSTSRSHRQCLTVERANQLRHGDIFTSRLDCCCWLTTLQFKYIAHISNLFVQKSYRILHPSTMR